MLTLMPASLLRTKLTAKTGEQIRKQKGLELEREQELEHHRQEGSKRTSNPGTLTHNRRTYNSSATNLFLAIYELRKTMSLILLPELLIRLGSCYII